MVTRRPEKVKPKPVNSKFVGRSAWEYEVDNARRSEEWGSKWDARASNMAPPNRSDSEAARLIKERAMKRLEEDKLPFYSRKALDEGESKDFNTNFMRNYIIDTFEDHLVTKGEPTPWEKKEKEKSDDEGQR